MIVQSNKPIDATWHLCEGHEQDDQDTAICFTDKIGRSVVIIPSEDRHDFVLQVIAYNMDAWAKSKGRIIIEVDKDIEVLDSQLSFFDKLMQVFD